MPYTRGNIDTTYTEEGEINKNKGESNKLKGLVNTSLFNFNSIFQMDKKSTVKFPSDSLNKSLSYI